MGLKDRKYYNDPEYQKNLELYYKRIEYYNNCMDEIEEHHLRMKTKKGIVKKILNNIKTIFK